MRVITAGVDYEIINRQNPNLTQAIHFVHSVGGKIEKDGTTIEEILKVAINYLETKDAIVPDYHNAIGISLLASVLNHQKERTKERIAQSIQGTKQETKK